MVGCLLRCLCCCYCCPPLCKVIDQDDDDDDYPDGDDIPHHQVRSSSRALTFHTTAAADFIYAEPDADAAADASDDFASLPISELPTSSSDNNNSSPSPPPLPERNGRNKLREDREVRLSDLLTTTPDLQANQRSKSSASNVSKKANNKSSSSFLKGGVSKLLLRSAAVPTSLETVKEVDSHDRRQVSTYT